MVVDEEEDGETGEDIKVPIMPDHIRQEMFTKYMQDQDQWSYQNLSKHYGSSLIRTKAIILLMQRRHNMIAEAESTLRRLAGEEAGQKEASGALKLLPIVDIPATLRALYAKHKEDVSVPLGALISAHNDALTESGSSEKRITIEEADLKAAFDIIARITQRQENFEEATEAQEEEIEDLHGDLIETDFRESPTEFRTSKAHNYLNRPNKHVRQSFQHNYYPTMASDKNAKREEVRLLQRIEEETKAQLEHDVEYYERKYALQNPAEALQEARSTPLPAALQHHQPPASDAPLSRWKIAFQDLSQSAVPKTKKSLRVPDRTVIRTRAGE